MCWISQVFSDDLLEAVYGCWRGNCSCEVSRVIDGVLEWCQYHVDIDKPVGMWINELQN